MLEQWRQEVIKYFGFDFPYKRQPGLLDLVVRKQIVALTFTYYHVIILLYRPFLLDTFSDVPSEREIMINHVQGCLEASVSIIELLDRLYEKDKSFHTLWVSGYFR